MKLGIVVVYLFDANTEYLFDLQISYIRKFTVSPYTIYGSVGRLDSKWRQKLSNYPEIQQCEIASTELRGSAEHAFYLERLTEIAFREGATHVVTLHLDSFPVCMGWEGILEAITAQSGTCVAADEAYTACLFFTKDFYFCYRPTFNFVNDPSEYLEFVKKYKLINHSGTPYLYACYKNYLDWHILKKISQNPISRFGYLCGDLIFHFEAGISHSPGRGLSQEIPPGKIHSMMLIPIQILRKIPFFRAVWAWICKQLPKNGSYLLKKWLANQAPQAEIAEKEFLKARLIRHAQFRLFDVINSGKRFKDAIQLCNRETIPK